MKSLCCLSYLVRWVVLGGWVQLLDGKAWFGGTFDFSTLYLYYSVCEFVYSFRSDTLQSEPKPLLESTNTLDYVKMNFFFFSHFFNFFNYREKLRAGFSLIEAGFLGNYRIEKKDVVIKLDKRKLKS